MRGFYVPSALWKLKMWTLSSLLARGDEWRLSLFKASSASEEILDSSGKGKQFFIWEALSIVQSCVHNTDFLQARDSAAHSCPARALPGCSGAVGVLCRTPEGHGDSVPVVGEQSQPWWSRLTPELWAAGCCKGTDPVCARHWSSCQHCADTSRVSLQPVHQTEAARSKVIINLLLLFPSVAAVSIPYSLGNTALMGYKAGFSSWQCSGQEEQTWGPGMLPWCSAPSELLVQKETRFVHSSWGTSAVLTAEKTILLSIYTDINHGLCSSGCGGLTWTSPPVCKLTQLSIFPGELNSMGEGYQKSLIPLLNKLTTDAFLADWGPIISEWDTFAGTVLLQAHTEVFL